LAKDIEKYPMAPSDYRNFLRQVDLEEISLDCCSVKTNRNNLGNNLKVEVQHKANYTIEEDNSAVITSSYDLTATMAKKKDFAIKVTCAFRVILSSEQPLTDDFMKIYNEINVDKNTWPYYREFVQNMIIRAGFPPLTLPLIKR